MVGVNVIAAETDEEAQFLATSQLKSFADLFQHGKGGPLGPPIENIDEYIAPAVKEQARRMLARSIVGSPTTVKQGLEALIAAPEAAAMIAATPAVHLARAARSSSAPALTFSSSAASACPKSERE